MRGGAARPPGPRSGLPAGGWPRRPAALLLAAVLLFLVAPPVAPALAAPAAAAQAPGGALQLTLQSIATWTGPREPLRVRLGVTNRGAVAMSGLQLRLYAGEPLNSRSELTERLDSPAPAFGSQLDSRLIQNVSLAPGASATLPAQAFTLPPRVGVLRSGAVVPLRFEVTATTGAAQLAVGRVDTFAVYISERVVEPLRLSVLLRFYEPTHRLPDGTFVDDRLTVALDSLGKVLAALEARGAPRLDLMVDPMLVEEATAMSGNGWRLRREGTEEFDEIPGTDPRSRLAFGFNQDLRAAANRQGTALYALPYAYADLAALARGDLARDVTTQLARGRTELQQLLDRAPSPTLAFPVEGHADETTLKALHDNGISSVVLDAAQLPGTQSRNRTASAPVELAGADRPARAFMPDATLSAALASRAAAADPVGHAQRVLAETALTWLERPNDTKPRGILLAPPSNWRPGQASFEALLRGMGTAPWLRTIPLERLADEVRPGPATRPQRLGAYTERMAGEELPDRYLDAIRLRQQQLDSFVASTPQGGTASTGELQRYLLVAESATYRNSQSRARGTRYLRAVDSGIREVYDQVRVEDTPVVLTASEGPLQVTAINGSDVPLSVRLRLTADGVDVSEELSEPFSLPPDGGHTQRVQVRTRGTGNYLVRVELITADQRQVIGTGTVVVRSTAVSRVTLLVIGGAAGFLVVWWVAKQLRRRRPGRDGGSPPSGRAAEPEAPDTAPADIPAGLAGTQAPTRSVQP